MVNGWINLYKPSGYSSSYCISLLKKKFKFKKIGHAGTLDPLADGILPVAINEATKTIKFINNKKKTYFFEIVFTFKVGTKYIKVHPTSYPISYPFAIETTSNKKRVGRLASMTWFLKVGATGFEPAT